jgi:hypothetical protein
MSDEETVAALLRRIDALERQVSSLIAGAGAASGGYPAVSGLTAGQPLRATAAGAVGFGPLDLANANAVTGDLPDANLSANVPLLDVANTFSAVQRLASGSGIYEAGVSDASLQFSESGTLRGELRYLGSGGSSAARYFGFINWRVGESLRFYVSNAIAGDTLAMYVASTGAMGIGKVPTITSLGDLDVAGRVRGATIETAAGSKWALAGYTAAADAASNGYVTVTIGGVAYKLSTRT